MVIEVNDKRNYNLFLFLSTLTRNLIEVFSTVLLYSKGYSIKDIFLFLLITYLGGIIISYITFIINYKAVLIISILLYGASYLFLSVMDANIINLIIDAVIFASSNYSYHIIRHYLALNLMFDSNKLINSYLLFIIYMGGILANIFGVFFIDRLPMFIISVIIIFIAILSIVPVFKLKDYYQDTKVDLLKVKIDKKKIIYSILEQFKVILLEIQPLYLYLYINNSFSYIGIFNIIINLASLIVMLIVSKKFNVKVFRYINILLGIVLILKINIKNSYFLLGIAFLEGVGMKLYEKFSLDNLYDLGNNDIKSYLIGEELIFFISKSLIMFCFLLFIASFKSVLYICIIGIIISAFFL
jgi:hypothetical protein